MITKIKTETIQRGNSYFGRIAVYENGRRVYSVPCEVARLSRYDARRDAQLAAVELLEENGMRACTCAA